MCEEFVEEHRAVVRDLHPVDRQCWRLGDEDAAESVCDTEIEKSVNLSVVFQGRMKNEKSM